jgi:hypothetical protein
VIKAMMEKMSAILRRYSRTFYDWKKEILRKDKFWIPKYVADAYEGKTLWLLIDEGEILSKYHHGSESPPPADEQYASEFEAFKTTHYEQKAVCVST